MFTIDQALEIVSREGWLGDAPSSFCKTVLHVCKLQDLKAAATIYAVGDPPGGMYGLVSGSLALSIAPGERGPYIAHFIRPGTWFGEVGALIEQPRRVGLAATRDSAVFHLPQHAIREILAADAGAWRFFFLATFAHWDVAIGAADDLMIRDHFKRGVAVLLRLGGCRLQTPPSATPIEVDISQEDFAAMTNVARTTAGRVLRALEAAGHVEVSYRRVRIVAPDALRTMLGG
jgi:CRP/FNR family cyclic AMP-dependent transcriptional regulator